MEYDKTDKTQLLDALESRGAEIYKDSKIACPYEGHTNGDQSPSGAVYLAQGGDWRYKCFGCEVNYSVLDVVAEAAGTDVPSMLRANIRESNETSQVQQVNTPIVKKKRLERPDDRTFYPTYDEAFNRFIHAQVVDVYPYTRLGKTEPCYYVIRTDPKNFPIIVREMEGFTNKGLPKTRPLYNINEAIQYSVIFVTEGEKDCNTLTKLGYPAVCCSGSKGGVSSADWSPLLDRTVVLLAHNDSAGDEYYQKVKECLPDIHYVSGKTWGSHDKADVTDMYEDRGHVEAMNFIEMIYKQYLPKSAAEQRFENADRKFQDDYKKILMPWKLMNNSTFDSTGMDEGGITVLAGAPATGKTFLLINMIVLWTLQGIKVSALLLESNRGFYLERVMAVITGDNRFIDDTFVGDMSNQERAEIIKQYGTLIDAVMDCITLPKEGEEATVDWIIAWSKREIGNDTDVLIVDPISAIEGSSDQWKIDKDFIRRFAKVVEVHNKRAFFTTHTNGQPLKDDNFLACVSGGKAVSRFTNNVWLFYGSPHEDPFYGTVSMKGKMEDAQWNRELIVGKARKGANGAGQRIAMFYHKETCAFSEVGYVIKRET